MEPDGSVRVGGSPERVIPLSDIARRCHDATPGEWADVVREYFDTALGASPPPGGADLLAHKLSVVRGQVKLCLYDDAAARGVHGIGRVFIPGLVAMIVIDKPPHSMHPLG